MNNEIVNHIPGYLESMLNDLINGEDNIDAEFMNSRVMYIISLSNPTAEDITDADNIIKISNIMYNNTDRSILPLDDGIYDLLMVWIQRFNKTYQVGALPTPTGNLMETRTLNNEDTLINPIIKLEPKKGMEKEQMLYYNDLIKPIELTPTLFLSTPIFDAAQLQKKNVNTPREDNKLVGTLDKCKFVLNQQAIDKGVFQDDNVQVFERDFIQKHLASGILDPCKSYIMVLELKYDGVSVEALVSYKVEQALSRGDTNNNLATDLTPVLNKYTFPRAVGELDPNDKFNMKFECMLSNLDLERLGVAREKIYKNPRNAIIGLLSAIDANKWIDYITLVPLATSLNIDRLTEIEFMNKYYSKGEILRYAVIEGTYKELLFKVKRFVDEAEYLRPIMPYIYDGVVCSFIDPDIIDKLGRENSVNKYQMAIKFNAQKKMTIFTGYTFSVAQNGVITPIAHYNPVELFGCTHSKTTVHSYKRFNEMRLRKGDVVNIELINDVIPYITRLDIKDNEFNTNPIIEFPTYCPECNTKLVLSKTGKTAMCPNMYCKGRQLGIIVNMLDKIGFKDFSAESLKQIGVINSLSDLVNIKIDDVKCLGDKEAENFINRLQEFLTTPIHDFRVLGALGFSDAAAATWKLILNKIQLQDILNMDINILRNTLLSIKGIGPNTADVIVNELDLFEDDIRTIISMPNVISSYGLVFNKKIRFTGCRDQELTDMLSAKGYDIRNGGGITKDTNIVITPSEDYTSSKLSKLGKDCIIVTLEEFKSNMSKYL